MLEVLIRNMLRNINPVVTHLLLRIKGSQAARRLSAIFFASLIVISSALAASGVARASGTITIAAPGVGATSCNTRFASEDVYPGNYDAMAPPSGGPTLQQRTDALGLDYWRIQAVSDATYFSGGQPQALSIPFPQSYTDANSHTVPAWDFRTLDKILSDGPAGVPRLLDITRPPDSLFTGTGAVGGAATYGAIADQSYTAMSQYFANIVRYFRTSILQTNSGATVTYAATSLTDTSKDFTAYGGGGYAVTATVLDANGFPDWETATITSVTNSGHTLNFSGGWSRTNSGALTGTSTPAAGAAYNLASATPPLISPVSATPWPLPPSVGNVQYYELFNEPDLSNYNWPRTSPALPAPTPTLTAINVAGGTLTPGNTYAYRMTAVNIGAAESLPGTEASITLPAGMNAVRLNWSATSNLGLSPFAYRIYGRAASGEQAMVVVGKDASSGLTWTDKGSVTPSGALPTADNTHDFQVFRGREYTRMWNVVAPAMKSVDATAKIVGPTISNPQSLAPRSVDTTVVTTGPNDNSWMDNVDYIQRLMTDGSPKPDVISFHNYGNWQGSTSTDASYFTGTRSGISDFLSVDQPYLGSTPAWITETNADAGFMDTTDYRTMTQLGSAFMADDLIQWCNQAPSVTGLFQFEVMNSNTWSLYAGGNPPANCYPQPACLNVSYGNPNLEYWVIHWIQQYFPAGSKVAPVSGVPAGYAAFAVQPPSSPNINVVVVNEQTGANPGVGTAGNLTVQLSGVTSTNTKEVVVDGSTNMVNGPGETSLGASSSVNLSLSGYAVALLSFNTGTIPADTTAPSVPTNLHSTASSSNSISLAWNASTDNAGGSGLAGYKLYRNGTLAATITAASGTSYTDTGLSAGTNYSYTISAFDASANESAQSSSISVSTAASPPVSPPPSVVGDCNGDGHVTVVDLSILLSHYNGTYAAADFNHDNIVNVFDLSTLLSNYGK